jgi:hypothetical protein
MFQVFKGFVYTNDCNKIKEKIMLYPTRVVINTEGKAVPPERAEEMGITWDVIYIRNDGWSLGASEDLAGVAYSLWAKEWVAVIKDKRIQPVHHT